MNGFNTEAMIVFLCTLCTWTYTCVRLCFAAFFVHLVNQYVKDDWHIYYWHVLFFRVRLFYSFFFFVVVVVVAETMNHMTYLSISGHYVLHKMTLNILNWEKGIYMLVHKQFSKQLIEWNDVSSVRLAGALWELWRLLVVYALLCVYNVLSFNGDFNREMTSLIHGINVTRIQIRMDSIQIHTHAHTHLLQLSFGLPFRAGGLVLWHGNLILQPVYIRYVTITSDIWMLHR